MSGADGSEAGRREVAYRLLAAEFDDATLSYSESDEERAPNYVVTPTGARVNRLFAVGVLTEVEQVNDDVLRGRVVDPTGAFVTYAGQYQPDPVAFLDRTAPPAFVALTGKARTFEPDDSDVVYTSVRPESINAVDDDTRDRWVVTAAEATLDRLAVFRAALESELRGDQLRERLLAAGVRESLAAGIPRAIDHYGTGPAYVEAVRRLATDALELVAGERESVRPLDVAPDSTDADEVGPLPAVELDLAAAPPTAAVEDAEVAEDIEAAGEAAGASEAAEEAVDAAHETDDGVTGAAEPTPGASAAEAGSADAPSETGESSAPAETAEPADADATTSAAGATEDDPGNFEESTDASPTTESSADDLGAFDADPADAGSEPDEAEGTVDAGEPAGDAGAVEPTGEAEAAESTDEAEPAESPSEAAAGDATAGVDSDEDEMYELDEEERRELEAEFGAEFTSGNEVDAPGEADIDVPGPADDDSDEADGSVPEPEPEAEAPATGESASPEAASATDDDTLAEAGVQEAAADKSTADDAATDDEATADDAATAGADTPTPADDAGDSEPASAADVDLETVAVEAMDALDDGDGASRDSVVEAVVDEYGADPEDVREAIESALMSGRCYEPTEDSLKAI